MDDGKFAHFLMLGQAAQKEIQLHPDSPSGTQLMLSEDYDLSTILVDQVSQAHHASETYRLFFVFENYLREMVVDVLVEEESDDWWKKIPKDIREEVEKLENREETKEWMALASREKLSLTTFGQLVAIIDKLWKEGFQEVVRDKALIQSARVIAHLRNSICHMTDVPDEEVNRVRMVMRDWFRIAPP